MPALFTDTRGTLHLIFGRGDTIFYAASTQGGTSFSAPVVAGVLPDLVAFAKRGPQVAATVRFVVITAVDKSGTLHSFTLDRNAHRWQVGQPVTDLPDVAKEGFQALAVTANGTFHAAWLDVRWGKQKIAGAASTDGGRTWSANRLLYASPDSTVCECCRLSMVAAGNDVYIQFRNFIGGARDLYLLHSADGGRTYAPAQKLGKGTWKLNACPMDGGTVALQADGKPITVWRRESTVYQCLPGKPEQAVAEGRNCTLAVAPSGPVMAWETKGTLFVKPPHGEAVPVGAGQVPSLAVVRKNVVCVWEDQKQIRVATVALNN
ncbi:MAG: glycoside hydrolase [Cytophagaceae bacterium]|nr:glycoside hydrolase [Cytophagaceae bacterium]